MLRLVFPEPHSEEGLEPHTDTSACRGLIWANRRVRDWKEKKHRRAEGRPFLEKRTFAMGFEE